MLDLTDFIQPSSVEMVHKISESRIILYLSVDIVRGDINWTLQKAATVALQIFGTYFAPLFF